VFALVDEGQSFHFIFPENFLHFAF